MTISQGVYVKLAYLGICYGISNYTYWMFIDANTPPFVAVTMSTLIFLATLGAMFPQAKTLLIKIVDAIQSLLSKL